MLYGQNVLGKKLSLYFLPAKSEGNYVKNEILGIIFFRNIWKNYNVIIKS